MSSTLDRYHLKSPDRKNQWPHGPLPPTTSHQQGHSVEQYTLASLFGMVVVLLLRFFSMSLSHDGTTSQSSQWKKSSLQGSGLFLSYFADCDPVVRNVASHGEI